MQAFRRKILQSFSRLKLNEDGPSRLIGRCQSFVETYCIIFSAFSETMASTDESTRHQNSKDHLKHHRVSADFNPNRHYDHQIILFSITITIIFRSQLQI